MAAERIVQHMNDQHQPSLMRYLEHWHKVPSSRARQAKLTSVTKEKLVIQAAGTSYTLPLEPPLADLSQARDRLVSLDKAAIGALGRSPATLTKYLPPQGIVQWTIVVLVLGTLVLLGRPEHTAAYPHNTSAFAELAKRFPGFFAFADRVRVPVFWGVIVVHSIEATITSRVILPRVSLPVGSTVWYLWLVSGWVEGVGAMVRIGKWRRAEEKRIQEQAQKKH